MTQTTLDEARWNTSGDRMVAIFDDGAIALMTSIGYRTGLFETMEGLPRPRS